MCARASAGMIVVSDAFSSEGLQADCELMNGCLCLVGKVAVLGFSHRRALRHSYSPSVGSLPLEPDWARLMYRFNSFNWRQRATE